MFEHLHLDLDLIDLEISAARTLLDELETSGVEIAAEDFALAIHVRSLPSEVVTAAEHRVADLEKKKKAFAIELSQETQEFIGTMYAALLRGSNPSNSSLCPALILRSHR